MMGTFSNLLSTSSNTQTILVVVFIANYYKHKQHAVNYYFPPPLSSCFFTFSSAFLAHQTQTVQLVCFSLSDPSRVNIVICNLTANYSDRLCCWVMTLPRVFFFFIVLVVSVSSICRYLNPLKVQYFLK